ncbi:MAG TPA: hypothetical protein VMZ69_06645 [Saprospiraceae bacterium]|nr:hypothetical protein [Saprospiraceae bacterium]
MQNLFAFTFLLLLSLMITNTIAAQAWVQLGSSKVHGHVDHDEILVTALEGDFSAIKLFVENEGIQFEHVVVHFGNGRKEDLILRDFIPAGGETRVIDLPGRDRIIRKVDFFYKSNAVTKRKGKVVLYGRR